MTDHTTKLMQEQEMQNNVKSIFSKLAFGESLFIEENSKYIIIHHVSIEQNKYMYFHANKTNYEEYLGECYNNIEGDLKSMKELIIEHGIKNWKLWN